MIDRPEPGAAEKPDRQFTSLRERRGVFGIVVSWMIGILLLVVLVTLVLDRGDITLFAAAFMSADPLWLAAAFLLQSTTYACAAAIWASVLAKAGLREKTFDLLGLAIVELFANQALPTGGLSGSIMVMHGLLHRSVPGPIAATALLVATLSYYGAHLLIAISAFILLWWYGDFSRAWLSMAILFALIIITVSGSLLLMIRSHGRIFSKFTNGWSFAEQLYDVMPSIRRDIVKDWRVLSKSFILQSTIFMLDVVTLWLTLRSIGVAISPVAAFISFVLASVIATLAPLPLGLGSFEGACVALLHLLGVQVETALAATLIFRGLTFWLPMAPGIWLARREARAT